MDTLADLLASGRTQQARTEAEHILKKNPADLAALTTVAKAYLVDGNLVMAETFLRQIERQGETADVWVMRGNLAAQKDQPGEARRMFEAALQRPDAPAEAHFGYGLLLAEGEELEAAVPHFERAVSLHPTCGVYEYHLARALASTNQQPQRVMDLLSSSIEHNPFYPPSYLLLAKVLEITHRADEARELIQTGLTMCPNDPRLLSALTNADLLTAHVGEAFQAALTLALSQPDDPVAASNLALLLLAQEKYEPVLQLCAQFEQRGKSTAALKCIEATVYEARQPPDLDRAAACYQEGMAIDPHDWTAANNLGLLLLRRTDGAKDQFVSRAITVLEEAVRRKPGQPEPLLNLALAYVRAGDDQAAMPRAEELIGLDLPRDHPLREQAETLLWDLDQELDGEDASG